MWLSTTWIFALVFFLWLVFAGHSIVLFIVSPWRVSNRGASSWRWCWRRLARFGRIVWLITAFIGVCCRMQLYDYCIKVCGCLVACLAAFIGSRFCPPLEKCGLDKVILHAIKYDATLDETASTQNTWRDGIIPRYS